MGLAPITGGQHHQIELLALHGAIRAVAQHAGDAVGLGRGRLDLLTRKQLVLRIADHLLLIEQLIDTLDQVEVDHRVIGIAVFLQHLLAAIARLPIDEVGEARAEDLVDERAVVRRLQRTAAHHHRDLGGREALDQVHEDLGRALPAPDHRNPPRRVVVAILGDPVQIARRMHHARIAPATEGRGHLRLAAHAHHQIARQPFVNAPVRSTRTDTQALHHAVGRLRHYVDHFLAIVATLAEVRRDPSQVIVELDPAWEEGLQVDERFEPAAAVQIVDEGIRAARIAQGRQILQEGDLHIGVAQQHAAVPDEIGLAFDKGIARWAHGPGSGRGTCALFHRNGQRQIRWPEANAE